MVKPLHIFLIICSLLNPFSLFAQEGNPYIKDFQTWSSIDVDHSFNKHWKGFLGEELRLKDNSTQLRTSFTDVGIKWKALKNFSVSGAYRLIIRPQEITNRLYADLAYQFKENDLTVTGRIRLQHEFVPDANDENYIRPDLSFEYKINKHFQPFAEGELFYHVLYYKGDELDEYRLSAGTTYKFDGSNDVKVFYLFEQQVNVNAAQQNYVLGVNYSHDF